MARFVFGDDRSQSTLFPERLDEYLGEDNPVRAIDVFVDELDLAKLGFGGVEPEATGRPAYHPATLLKIYVYGYLNRVQSSRRLERECQRNIELVWLTCRLMPDFKTIADFRKDNGEAIRRVCREFVMLCRRLELFSEASVAIDGSKFKAVNTRDRNFTQAKMERRLVQIDESIARYLAQLDSADRQGDSVPEAKITRLNEKIVALRQEIQRLNQLNSQMTREHAIEHQVAMKLRVGINSGPVVAGVIGRSKYIYDLWGDTVNLASRMESGGIPDTIQVTRPVYEKLKDEFMFEPRGAIEVKGKGSVEAWLLTL